ncbi:MAG TPA: winged helix-turn-helix domain-containing protein [Chitinophagaceae bacterium]|nr:winged helix-turn-helix domain-containing protein [Chitinophagaceae bacterium]
MEKQFKQVASLIGDPTRATIMWTLLDGKAFTATELAITADTSAQNISMHLNKLTQAGLLSAESQGRHKYYKFSRKEIAYAIEAMATLIPQPTGKNKLLVSDLSPVKYCRTCYDHLAGKVGVMITESLLKQKIIVDSNNAFEITKKGEEWFSNLDIPINDLKLQRRSFIRPCLDWSERRNHMAGSLAASLLEKMLSSDWVRRVRNSREIVITAKGKKKMNEYFHLSL